MAISEEIVTKLYERIEELDKVAHRQRHALDSTLLALQCVYTNKHFKDELFCTDIREAVFMCLQTVRNAIAETETTGILPE